MKNLTTNTTKIGMLVIAIIAVTVICSKLYFRLDVTEDSAYTLSDGSFAIANKLEDNVSAKLYFSKSLKDMPVLVKQYGVRIEEVLREYASASSGKLTVEVIDPRPDTDEEEWALKYGIRGAQMPSGDSLYLGVVLLSADKEVAIPYLDPRKEEFLEYDLSEAMLKLGNSEKPKLAVLSSLPVNGSGMPSRPGMPPQGGNEKWALIQSLENTFQIEKLETTVENIPSDTKVLFVIHPKELSDKTLYAIDQFVVKGGRLVVAVDPFSRIDLASSQAGGMGMGQMPKASSDLGKLFKAWDIEYEASKVIGDPNRGTPISVGGQRIIYPLFMTLDKQDLAVDNKVTNQLRQVLFAEGGSIAVKKGSKIKMEPLLQTTVEANTVEAMMLSFQRPADVAATFKVGDKKATLAATFTGKFASAFTKAPEGASGEFTKAASKDGLIAVFADVDFIHDSNAVNKMRFGPQTIVSPRNDNINLVLNTTEFMGGNEDLISIRSSGQIARPFTKVREIQKQAQIKWQAEEEMLSKELQRLQENLARLQSERTDGNRLSLTPQQQAEIQKFREDERKIKKRRRIVRKNLREDIESLGHRLIVLNLLTTPTLVAGFGFVVFRRRSNKEQEEKKSNG